MQVEKGTKFPRGLAVCGVIAAVIATAYGQDASKMSGALACRTVKELLPQAEYLGSTKVTGAHPASDGITINLKKKPDVNIAYHEAQYATNENYYVLCVHMLAGRKKSCLQFGWGSTWQESEALVKKLAGALTQLMIDEHDGHPFLCSDDPQDYVTQLSAFETKTAAWRALSEKPAISDEVNKKRLMAEDAIAHKDMDAAAGYYQAGVSIDPTWAQGWYNAALIYAELLDYSDAEYCMKHYLILLPGASDASVAKEKVLLWEAKAAEASKQPQHDSEAQNAKQAKAKARRP